MRFFALSEDLKLKFSTCRNGKNYEVKTYTSPMALKNWFFDCIRKFGEIIPLDEKLEKEVEVASVFKSPENIFLNVFGMNDPSHLEKIPKRTLRLSHCSFLVPDTLFSFKDFLPAQVDLVSTHFEMERIKICLGKAAPEIGVFTPKVDTDFFCLPDKRQRLIAREKKGLSKDQIHVVYAGRWIATKGIPQLIRALDIWPLPRVVVTLVGNFEPKFSIQHAVGNHLTFANFLKQEFLSQISRDWLCFQPTKKPEALRELFWSADLFVNPSIHSDENFGITPREAASCGVPVITTNFCGLRPLANNMPWGGVNTYPTIHGSRFSLRQFHRLFSRAISECKSYPPQEYRKAILKECNLQISQNDLVRAIQLLRKFPLKSYEEIKNIKQNFKQKVFLEANEKIVKDFFISKKDIPQWCYMYGSGPSHPGFKSLQGIYSAIEEPPKVERGSSWRGFFRIGFWEEERTLIEFGFPGPRMHRYKDKSWDTLIACSHPAEINEWIIIPENKEQVSIVQELVDYGYLIPDD